MANFNFGALAAKPFLPPAVGARPYLPHALLDRPSRQDVIFRLKNQPKDEDPLVGHAVLLEDISPVFKERLNENHHHRDTEHRIILEVADVDFSAMKKFLHGVYSKFEGTNLSFEEAKQMLRLASEFKITAELFENLYSLENFWACLEVGLHHPTMPSNLLQKCSLQLEKNRNLYDDKTELAKLQASTLQHILTLNRLPVSIVELREILGLWDKQHQAEANFLTNQLLLATSFIDFLTKHHPQTCPWQQQLLNISVPNQFSFTISYEPEADMTSVYDQIHAATNLPMDLLCVTKLGSTDAFNFSESTLEELGIQANDSLQVSLKYKISLREFDGEMHSVTVTGKETVEELKEIAANILEVKDKPNLKVQLVFKGKQLLNRSKRLVEEGIESGSEISVWVLEAKQKKLKGYGDENLAADPQCKFSASSIRHNDSRYGASHAVLGATNDGYWYADGGAPQWWGCEFPGQRGPKMISPLSVENVR